MKVKELLDYGIKSLKDAEIENHIIDAYILLADLLNIQTWELILLKEKTIDIKIIDIYKKRIKHRITGFPIAYITKKKEFFGLEFFVQEGVLIPRPETEILVEAVLNRLDSEKSYIGLDIGIGSGAISIALLKNRPLVNMLGIDISDTALAVSQKNAKIHNVTDRLLLLKSNLFQNIKGRKFDFIVSNPPYIPVKEYETLQKEVKKEPVEALLAGQVGTEFYEKILDEIDKYLKPKGFIAFEVGYNQGRIVEDLLKVKNFKTYSYKDLQGIDRVIIGEKHEK
ncbi:MAG: peptide chain release factor N(5)-glutamine methyltransferase [Aquificae bacterium]|nr:peptide chain release factor N(5)-glutamine methyltransferase [Aquificota bacterium]